MARSSISRQRLATRDHLYTLYFNGAASGRVTAFDPTGSSGAALTVSAWVKLNPADTVSSRYIVAQFDFGGATNKRSWTMLNMNGALQVLLSSDGLTSFKNYKGSIQIVDNQWHHVAFTWGSSTLKFYVDGIEDTSITKTIDTAGSAVYTTFPDLTLGAGLNNNAIASQITGRIAKVYIFPTALSASQIANIYYEGQNNIATFSAGYAMDEGSGTSAADSSGNGRNATLTSITWESSTAFKHRDAVASARTAIAVERNLTT